jgi:hypothetical protein
MSHESPTKDPPLPSRPKLRTQFAYGMATLLCVVTAFCLYQTYRTKRQILKYAAPAPEMDVRPEVDDRSEVVPYRFTDDDFVQPLDPRPTTVQLSERVEIISNQIEKLQALGDTNRATEMKSRLEKILENKDGRYPVDGKPQLHAIGIYGGDSRVKITYTGAPLIVALCAYEPALWTIEADPGVQLKKVILGGYHQQRVQGLPDGVSIEGQLNEARNETYSYHAFTPLEAHRVAKRLLEIAGMKPTTFQTTYGSYRTPKGPRTPKGSKGNVFCIGPGEPEWTASMTFSALEPLYQEAVREDRAKLASKLVGHSFPEVACTPADVHGTRFRCTFATHSIFGPYAKTMRPLNRSTTRFAVDPRGPSFFGFNWREGGIHTMDLESGTLTPWPVKGHEIYDSPHLDACLTFDTKRQRLLVWGGNLASVDVLKGEATLVCAGNPAVCALAYSQADDLLYACCTPYDRSPIGVPLSDATMSEIRTYNEFGAEVSRFPVNVPIPGQSHARVPGKFMKLTVVADALLITHLGGHDGHSSELVESDTNYVIDPKTGKLLFACKRKPR